MRLLTHNHLACVRKSCPKTYPLTLKAETVEQEDTDCNPAFIAHLMINIDYPLLYNTAQQLGLAAGLPTPDSQLPDWTALAARRPKENEEDDEDEEDEGAASSSAAAGAAGGGADAAADAKDADAAADSRMSVTVSRSGDDDVLCLLHSLLMDTHVTDGELICGGCQRRYGIQQGIPNMRLNEDEL